MKNARLLFLLILFSGCFQQIAVNSLGDIMDNGLLVLNEERDLDLAAVSIASNLKLIETLIRTDPGNDRFLLLACQGYTSYALGFIEDDSAERANVLYLRARDYGMRILSKNRAFAAALGGDLEAFRGALRSFGKSDVAPVFWTATAWGSSIALSLTDPGAIADLPRVEAMMQFVLSREPDYFYGGAHFFLGTLAGSRPKLLGGDADSSLWHFQECLRINGGRFLMTYVYEARSLAVLTQNQELFEACLTAVDTASLEVLPEARLSNAIAKRKAQMYRAKLQELF